ncbi:hypothetical protein RI367_003749 [Sorochytrium milnesiophthora]
MLTRVARLSSPLRVCSRSFSYDVNKAIIVGRVVNEPSFINFKADATKFISKLTVATNERTTRGHGEEREIVESVTYHNVVTIDQKLGEYLKRHAAKGQKIYVEGQISQQKYQDEEGKMRSSYQIEVNGPQSKLLLLDRRPSSQEPASDAPPA